MKNGKTEFKMMNKYHFEKISIVYHSKGFKMNNIDFEKSFYKTQDMLEESYKLCDKYKKANDILRYELLQIINLCVENDFTKRIRNTLNMTKEGVTNETL